MESFELHVVLGSIKSFSHIHTRHGGEGEKKGTVAA